jgi:hypothetical protein
MMAAISPNCRACRRMGSPSCSLPRPPSDVVAGRASDIPYSTYIGLEAEAESFLTYENVIPFSPAGAACFRNAHAPAGGERDAEPSGLS